ncbi:MAG: GntR family transcriptional regulator [Actinomycetes bacterium]
MHATVSLPEPASQPPLMVGRLRMLVADGSLPARDSVPIGTVATMLDVAPQAALGVLMELGRWGFLERVDDETVRVRAVAEDEIQDDILEIRRMLEPAAMRRAAEHARPVDLITLRALVDPVDAAVEARDPHGFRHAEDALAATLLSLHPNVELARLCVELRLRTAYDGLRAAVEEGVLGTPFRQHGRLVDLVESGDFDGVERLARDTVAALHYVGAPRMDSPYLAGAPIALDTEVDVEFLDADADG